MVCDSAFSDLTTLAEQMVEKGREQGLWAPNMLVSMAISMIRSSVKKLAKFDIKQVSERIAPAIPCVSARARFRRSFGAYSPDSLANSAGHSVCERQSAFSALIFIWPYSPDSLANSEF